MKLSEFDFLFSWCPYPACPWSCTISESVLAAFFDELLCSIYRCYVSCRGEKCCNSMLICCSLPTDQRWSHISTKTFWNLWHCLLFFNLLTVFVAWWEIKGRVQWQISMVYLHFPYRSLCWFITFFFVRGINSYLQVLSQREGSNPNFRMWRIYLLKSAIILSYLDEFYFYRRQF